MGERFVGKARNYAPLTWWVACKHIIIDKGLLTLRTPTLDDTGEATPGVGRHANLF